MNAETPGVLRSKDAAAMIEADIDNWVRWGKCKDYLPRSFKCPLGTMYRTRDDNSVEKRLPIRTLDAERFSDLVMALEWKPRMAFVMFHLRRASINKRMVHARNRADIWNLIGVGERRYQQLLQQAHNSLYRSLLQIKFDRISLLA